MALDQATKISGYSLFEDNKLITYGVLLADEKEKNPIERMKQMNDEIISLIDKYQPDFIVFENVQFQRNYGTFQQLSQLQGIVMAYLFKLDVGFQIIEPSAWKSFCGIKGKKRDEQKKNTQAFVKMMYKVSVSEDEADAIGIGFWAINNITPSKS
ncbi:MAG: crossover junction endodeoxyribonuclease RuvC [Tissierellia bacterium]|nr:crossover junction endodeoxyribonuclease RuvC [Tissierellia bacterium]